MACLFRCSQLLYALRVLRHHGLTEVGLYTVFRSVVVAKILYACSAWSGFITASDRHVTASTRSSAAADAVATVNQTFRRRLRRLNFGAFNASNSVPIFYRGLMVTLSNMNIYAYTHARK